MNALLLAPSAPERGQAKPRKRQGEKQGNSEASLRNAAGYQARVLAHQGKTANRGKAEENETSYLEEEKVQSAGDCLEDGPGSVHESASHAAAFRAARQVADRRTQTGANRSN